MSQGSRGMNIDFGFWIFEEGQKLQPAMFFSTDYLLIIYISLKINFRP